MACVAARLVQAIVLGSFLSGCVAQRQVQITSDPNGATVAVDGVEKGVTPLKVLLTWENPADDLNVTVRLEPGYDAGRISIPWSDGGRTKYHVTLNRAGSGGGSMFVVQQASNNAASSSSSASSAASAFCAGCGEKLPSDGCFCPRCGVRVKGRWVVRATRRRSVAAVLAAVAAVSGCANLVGGSGGIVSAYSGPVSLGDGNVVPNKVGKSEAYSIIAGLVTFGDASIEAAMKEGAIEKVHHADFECFGVLLLFSHYVLRVYGTGPAGSNDSGTTKGSETGTKATDRRDSSASRFCRYCGARLTSSGRSCDSCGKTQ